MAWMTRQDITIGGYQLMELSQFQIQAEVNQHGKLYLEGMLSEDTVRRLETTDQSGQTIQIIAAGKVIFTGQPERIEIHTFNGCHTMKLEAAGFSNQLSLVPHSYFYQDTAQSYEDMLRKAVEHCGGSLIAVQGQERIPAPVGAVGFLVGINKGGTFGGSIASILLNTPGSPESAATC